MKKILLLTALLILNLMAQVNQAKQGATYLCVAEKASGFAFVESEWLPQAFNTDSKYILKRTSIKPDGERLYSLTNFGRNFPSIEDCKQHPKGNTVRCSNALGSFTFSIESKRFIKSYLIGYLTGDAESGDDTPHLEIGVCTKI